MTCGLILVGAALAYCSALVPENLNAQDPLPEPSSSVVSAALASRSVRESIQRWLDRHSDSLAAEQRRPVTFKARPTWRWRLGVPIERCIAGISWTARDTQPRVCSSKSR